MTNPGDLPAVGTLWRHHKGTLYRVVGHARDGNTGETGVLYERCEGHQGPPWFHRLFAWWDHAYTPGVEITKGTLTRRFTEVE